MALQDTSTHMTDRSFGRIEASRELVSARRLAGGLLLGMGGLLLLFSALPAFGFVEDSGFLQLLRAGARAGVVGGLADWFAVTALFRHPLGIPIPHTAIIPRQKARLGQALGRFISGQFFSDEDVKHAIARAGLPDLLAEAIRDPSNRAAVIRTVQDALPPIVALLEDGRAASAIRRAFPVLLQGEDSGLLVARSLRALVDSALHQEVLTFLLSQVKEGLVAREPLLRQFIEERVREQGGRVVGWAIGASVANRVLSALNMELERVDPSDSKLREGFTVWVREEIDRIEQEAGHRARLGKAISDVCGHETLQAWCVELWRKLRTMLEADLACEQGWSMAVIDAALLRLADEFSDDAGMRHRIETGGQIAASRVLPSLRETLARYIASVVDRWSETDMAERLEQRVGRDLQYIRVNGTLFGFVAGMLLDGIFRVIFGSLP